MRRTLGTAGREIHALLPLPTVAGGWRRSGTPPSDRSAKVITTAYRGAAHGHSAYLWTESRADSQTLMRHIRVRAMTMLAMPLGYGWASGNNELAAEVQGQRVIAFLTAYDCTVERPLELVLSAQRELSQRPIALAGAREWARMCLDCTERNGERIDAGSRSPDSASDGRSSMDSPDTGRSRRPLGSTPVTGFHFSHRR